MKQLKTIILKELKRFLSDRRILLSTILLPGLLIYFIYSFIGDSVSDLTSSKNDYKMFVVSDSKISKEVFKEYEYEMVNKSKIDDIKNKVENQEAELLVVFDEDFDKKISDSNEPNIQMFYNSSNPDSLDIFDEVQFALDNYESLQTNLFNINSDDKNYDLTSEEEFASSLMSNILPMLIITMLFAGATSISTESIAGEKERGSLSTILATPIKREYIALGKIISLSIIGLLSAASSLTGILLSFPKIIQADSIKASGIYGISDYVKLALIVISTMLLIVSILLIVSALSKNVKEAGTYMAPVMVVMIVVSLTSMDESLTITNLNSIVPVLNSSLCLKAVFGLDASFINIISCVGSNLLYTGFFVFVLTKMFNSEKIIYS